MALKRSEQIVNLFMGVTFSWQDVIHFVEKQVAPLLAERDEVLDLVILLFNGLRQRASVSFGLRFALIAHFFPEVAHRLGPAVAVVGQFQVGYTKLRRRGIRRIGVKFATESPRTNTGSVLIAHLMG